MLNDHVSYDPLDNTKASFKNVVAGILLFLGSFWLLSWNEGNFVNNQKKAQFISDNVISVNSYSPENDRKLIHYSGKINTTENLSDEYVSINVPVLSRKVEMYQWKERSRTKDGRRRYSYSKVWSEKQIDSGNFYRSASYENPVMKLQSQTQYAQNVTIGDFSAGSSLLQNVTPSSQLSLASLSRRYNIVNNHIYIPVVSGQTGNVGDYRISYTVIPNNSDISVISTQYNKTLSMFKNSKFEISILEPGKYSAEEMVEHFINKNNISTMLFRCLGFGLMFFGLCLFISPVTSVMSFIPIIGEIGSGAVHFAAFIIALVLSAVTIGIAWIAVRPEIAIPAIIAAIAAGYFLLKLKKPKPQTLPPEQV